eukprot:TRINITY_DN1468_c0_g1_i1.p1 TRINITY_DN1468_c0_g1~~TRINITY_DN1468_c0_g1_i1.p1  ORF type:complete len:71 (+),score=11.26 TRINITY_DN1468_c0_g1_i1:32-214(+)
MSHFCSKSIKAKTHLLHVHLQTLTEGIREVLNRLILKYIPEFKGIVITLMFFYQTQLLIF